MKKQGINQIILKPLFDLGNSSAKIVASLKKKKIRGGHHHEDCPFAKILKEYYNETVEVDSQRIRIGDIVVETPAVLAKVIDDYDAGEYPELETAAARKEREAND